MRPINKIIIHCTATPEGREVTIDDVRDWHVNGNGWSDIGYHYLITLDGEIQSGRPIELLGAHCRGQNKFSIGIAYAGGMNKRMTKAKDTRTKEQKEALVKLIARIRKDFPEITVHGHNEYTNKECPSFDVQAENY